MTKMDSYVAKILQEHLPSDIKKEDAVWFHKQSGQWIAKHRTLEIIAVKCGVYFNDPVIIESDVANGICVLSATGHIPVESIDGGLRICRSEWSIGEASPANCKNQYPAAMAEKRAKDRVILKLLGLHGYVYSDQEIDTTDQPAKKTKKEVMQDAAENSAGEVDYYELAGDVEEALCSCTDLKRLGDVWKQNSNNLRWIKEFDAGLYENLNDTKNELKERL